jgi:hypothetical protein
MACKGISKTKAWSKIAEMPVIDAQGMGSFDLKTIRKRMAFYAQDDNVRHI